MKSIFSRAAAVLFYLPIFLGSLAVALLALSAVNGGKTGWGVLAYLLPAAAGGYFALSSIFRIARSDVSAWGLRTWLTVLADLLIVGFGVIAAPYFSQMKQKGQETHAVIALNQLRNSALAVSPGTDAGIPKIEGLKLVLPESGHAASYEIRTSTWPHITDSGKWLLVDNPGHYYSVMIDCTHTDTKGKVWSQY